MINIHCNYVDYYYEIPIKCYSQNSTISNSYPCDFCENITSLKYHIYLNITLDYGYFISKKNYNKKCFFIKNENILNIRN